MLLQIGLTPAQSSSMVVSFGLYLSCGQEHDRPTPPSMQGLHTEVVISELNTWPVGTPVNASPASLRMQVHDSEPKWCATPFLCGSLIRYSLPVYPGAFLDHPIRLEKHRIRNRETHLFGGLQVNHQLELCWLLDGYVGRLGPFKNLVH